MCVNPQSGGHLSDMDSSAARPYAVVTGASSGIGLELARVFAEEGFDVLVTAEDAELASAAQDLQSTGAAIDSIQVDLSRPEGVEELYGYIRSTGRPVDTIALNAGVGAGGGFASGEEQTALEDELYVIDLNVRSTVHLAKYVIRDMVDRGQGRVLFTSSIGSTQPGAFHAVYNASKAFVQSFAVAIRDELKASDTGVTVTSVMPGPTDTEFFDRAGLEDTRIGSGPKDDPAQVARQGFKALMDGEEQIVAGSIMTKMLGRSGRFMPDTVKAAMHRKMAEPKSAE